MPSINPRTGKQLSGAEKLARKREREVVASATSVTVADDSSSIAFTPMSITPPPQRVDDIVVWAQVVCQRVSASLMRDKAKALPTAMTAIHLLRSLPKMRPAAAMSEMAVEVENDGRPIVLDDNAPPMEPLAGPAWAFRRCATIAHELLTGIRPIDELPVAAVEIEAAKLTCQLSAGHLIDVIVSDRT